MMGRNWIKALGVTLKRGEIHSIEESKSLHDVLEKHSTLFEEKLGCLKVPLNCVGVRWGI